jgi:hypothetical protein
VDDQIPSRRSFQMASEPQVCLKQDFPAESKNANLSVGVFIFLF